MPPPYQKLHWSKFVEIPHSVQGAVGTPPAIWAKKNALPNIPNASQLPALKLCRQQVRQICIDPSIDVLFAYICVMAWGGQGEKHALSSWSHPSLSNDLRTLRKGGLSRRDAYMIFESDGKIPGLGPSYFTKLLYFFSQNFAIGEAPYIVDNKIRDSMTLLTGSPFDFDANRGSYQACCEEIDDMSIIVGRSGQEIEERLFSQRGAPWWKYVNKAANSPNLSRPAYRQQMHSRYSHIVLSDFQS